MTREEVLALAKQVWVSEYEAEMIGEYGGFLSSTYIEDLEGLANLIEQKVREECAQVAEMPNMAQSDIARVIREK